MNPVEVLEASLQKAERDEFQYLVVVAVLKDGTQWAMSSDTTHEQKSFCLAFFQAWVLKWFKI